MEPALLVLDPAEAVPLIEHIHLLTPAGRSWVSVFDRATRGWPRTGPNMVIPSQPSSPIRLVPPPDIPMLRSALSCWRPSSPLLFYRLAVYSPHEYRQRALACLRDPTVVALGLGLCHGVAGFVERCALPIRVG